MAQQHVQLITSVFEDLYKRGHILRFEGQTKEDQINPLGLEIESFEGENPPWGFSPLVLEPATLWDKRRGLEVALKLRRTSRDLDKMIEDLPCPLEVFLSIFSCFILDL